MKKVKLLIDAGATKSDWVVFDGTMTKSWTDIGINPLSNPKALNDLTFGQNLNEFMVEKIYYYGAGIRNNTKQVIHDFLTYHFPKVDAIEIEDDLAGANKSVFNDRPKIVGILGTGSNFGLFQSDQLQFKVPSPGYLFGEYGSGFAIGKSIVESYLFDKMDKKDGLLFESFIKTDKNSLLKELYNSDKPNFKLASFTYFLNKAPKDFSKSILENCFNDLFQYRIGLIPDSKNYKLNFVGSIAFRFKEELTLVATQKGYTIDQIEKSPIKGLLKYHLNFG